MSRMIIMNIFFSLSVHTGLNIREGMTIKDIHGNAHDLTQHHVRFMLAVGWACFLGSWLINIAYYKFHPSAVDVFDLSEKKKLFVFGKDVLSSGKNLGLFPQVKAVESRKTLDLSTLYPTPSQISYFTLEGSTDSANST